MTRKLIYKPTQNRKTNEIIQNILSVIGISINIVFTDNLCMLGSQTSGRIIKEIKGVSLYRKNNNKSITIHCESEDIDGVSRKQISTHIYGLIIGEGVRNIITLTNSVRLPQIRGIIDLLIHKDSLGRSPIVPDSIPIINMYFDEADKTIRSICRELDELLNKEFIHDFYVTATPKKILKKYGSMELYPVSNLLDTYINLQHANWIDIGSLEYLDSLRQMMKHIITIDGTRISPQRFIFAPGINLKESHYEIAEESTNVYQCISIVVNSDGLIILLPATIHESYLSNCTNSQRVRIPRLPTNLQPSLSHRNCNKMMETSGGSSFYKLVFHKKLLISDNDNEFWKVMGSIRSFWKDNPVLVTGSRCIERGITIQNPFDKRIRFTDGMLHCNISRTDSGSQMAGRFTLTYNDSLSRSDFKPINIFSNEKTKLYMINQEKKAMYAVELSSLGKDTIRYDEWKGYERRSVLGCLPFQSFLEAILYTKDNLGNTRTLSVFPSRYLENEQRLGSCNMIQDTENIYNGFRYNSFDTKEKIPISEADFRVRCIRHLCWREGHSGNVYRIWAVYTDLTNKQSLKYYLCYTPLALHDELNESDSDSDL